MCVGLAKGVPCSDEVSKMSFFFFFAKGIPFRSACTASISLNLFLGERQGGGSLVEIVFDFISKFKKKEKESFGQQKKR